MSEGTVKTIQFTPDEADLMLDRFAVDDAMLEALMDYDPEHDTPPPYDRDQIEDSLIKLSRALEHPARRVVLDGEVDEIVLAESIEGATILYRSKDAYDDRELTKAQWTKILQTARSIERKLLKAKIVTTGFPPT